MLSGLKNLTLEEMLQLKDEIDLKMKEAQQEFAELKEQRELLEYIINLKKEVETLVLAKSENTNSKSGYIN